MSLHESNFELARDIERYLAALSKVYAEKKQGLLQKIIVNSQVRIYEGWYYDQLGDGMDYHALYLVVPESIYLPIIDKRDELQTRIKQDLNKMHNVENESIGKVFLELEAVEGQDWRKESGVLLSGNHDVLPNAVSRIWGDEDFFRIFLSHKDTFKEEAERLKNRLLIYGISSFVAHKDIEPTKEWQDEIENALFSMDAFVALMTAEFHDSDWTDQEVGVAIGRGTPKISVKLGKAPYGFIGKFQALSCPEDALAEQIVKLLLKHDRMLNAYIKAVRNCGGFDIGNALSRILPYIDKLSEQQANDLISAYNENSEVSDSFGFKGKYPWKYGGGLVSHLNRLTGRTYKVSSVNIIEIVP